MGSSEQCVESTAGSTRAARALVLLCAALAAAPARADEPRAPFTLAELLRQVQEHSPELAERAAMTRGAGQRAAAEGLPDDPMVMLEWYQQPVDFSKVPLMLTVKSPIPWPSRLEARRELGRREAATAGTEAAQVQRRLAADARRAYFDLVLAERSLALNHAQRGLMENLVAVADARYRVGKAVQADWLKAQGELLLVENDGIDLEREERRAVARINALLDRPSDAPLPPPATAPRIVALPPAAELLALALARRPEAKRLQAMIATAEQRAALAATEDLPELAAWGGFMHEFGGMNMFTIGLSTSLPIFSGRRRPLLESAARSEVEGARAQLAALRRQTELELREALLALETAARHEHLHAEKLIPLADVTLESARAAYEAGRLDFLNVIEAARAVRMHHGDHLRFLIDFEKRRTDLEQVLGVDLDAATEQP